MTDSDHNRSKDQNIRPWWNDAPVRSREWLILLLMVGLADVAVYHGTGFSGWAVLFAATPFLLAAGSPRPRFGLDFLIATPLLLIAAIRLAWLGSVGLVLMSCGLVVGVGMALAGIVPFFAQVCQFCLQILPAGLLGLLQYRPRFGKPNSSASQTAVLGVAMPIGIVCMFGTIFVMANPDLANLIGEKVTRFVEWFGDSFTDLLPQPLQVLFWIAVAWVTVGIWRPLPVALTVTEILDDENADSSDHSKTQMHEQSPSQYYSAYRNSLLAVVILFAAYLVFEFKTLWFREFPEGFYYSGYAHQGAAWLTVALALSTVVLSVIFRGQVLRDPRCPTLRSWGWLWSAENGLLALAVFNRLGIYIQFNGMTRMRVVGLLGICSVIVGFLLVLRKVTKNHSFLWLVRRQALTVCFFVWFYLVLPVDLLVHTANTRWVLAGHPAPSVQISEHPLDASALCAISPLLESRDPIIRDGVRALYARTAIEWFDYNATADTMSLPQHWTAYQGAEQCLYDRLLGTKALWKPFTPQSRRSAALWRFHEYSMQWW